ncbi:uncharacterized protein LOC142525622 isoform X2 [Primulina tabacum]|uniref:uncharacterized protein LOC142525622 isoform X2 n=1 Tax=Primulina tabacum TaxID=48773 RepID=UPI003F5A7A3B
MGGRKRGATSGLVYCGIVENQESRGAIEPNVLRGRGLNSTSFRVAYTINFSECDFAQLHVLPLLLSCPFCAAKKFHSEPPSFCCDNGKISLSNPAVPINLKSLFTDQEFSATISFRRKIRLYNSIFSFTSFGVKIDKQLAASSRGIYTLRVSGQIFHTLPPLIPNEDGPTYFQLYFWDNENELHNRMNVVGDAALDENTMEVLMDVMKGNPYVELLRRLNQYPCIQDLRLHIYKNAPVDQRRYNTPTADQVAAIWVEGNNPNIPYDRDIIVCSCDGRSHQIKHYSRCYDPLQYPLFFPNGENGWHQNIPKVKPGAHDDCTASNALVPTNFPSIDDILSRESSGVRGSNNRMVSCREYYSYKLQIRDNDSSILLYGGRLLQQFIVDMYVKLETTRLDYYRLNQAEMRSELYQGIVDSVVRGEARGSEVGKHIVLSASFIGGPRDMRRRYLDAIALVRTFGNQICLSL